MDYSWLTSFDQFSFVLAVPLAWCWSTGELTEHLGFSRAALEDGSTVVTGIAASERRAGGGVVEVSSKGIHT